MTLVSGMNSIYDKLKTYTLKSILRYISSLYVSIKCKKKLTITYMFKKRKEIGKFVTALLS